MVHISSEKYWRKPTVQETAKLSGLTVDDVIEDELLRKDGVILLKLKSVKREKRKLEIIKKVMQSLPCTFSVLKRRTKLSKTTLSRYLKKLVWLDVVYKMHDDKTDLDIYYLFGDFMNSRTPLRDVWFKWINDLPEYQIHGLDFEKRSKVYKRALKGKKPTPKSIGRKIREYRREHKIKT